MKRESLESAYLATDYWVEPGDAPAFAIHIGEIAEPLQLLLSEQSAQTWAFISAENPRSTLLSEVANRQRTLQLEALLKARVKVHLPGHGRGRDGQWPAEASFLILDVSLAEAKEIASLFEQHALVSGRVGEKAQLIWVE